MAWGQSWSFEFAHHVESMWRTRKSLSMRDCTSVSVEHGYVERWIRNYATSLTRISLCPPVLGGCFHILASGRAGNLLPLIVHRLPDVHTRTHKQDVDPLELARQLTVIEWEIFRRIHPSETLGLAWNVKEKQHLAKNIISLIARANDVCGVFLCAFNRMWAVLSPVFFVRNSLACALAWEHLACVLQATCVESIPLCAAAAARRYSFDYILHFLSTQRPESLHQHTPM